MLWMYHVCTNRGMSRSLLLTNGVLDLPSIQPGEEGKMHLPEDVLELRNNNHCWMTVTFSLAKDQSWEKAGHVLAWYQTELSPRSLPSPSRCSTRLHFSEGPYAYYISTKSTRILFSHIQGHISEFSYNGHPVLTDTRVKSYNSGSPSPLFALDFWRPQTDNDAAWQTGQWKRYGLHMMTGRLLKIHADISTPSQSAPSRYYTQEGPVRASIGDFKVTIRAEHAFAPPSLDWYFHVVTTYAFSTSSSTTDPDISIKIHTHITPKGSFPANLPRIGYSLQLCPEYTHVKWSGRGPLESYNDKRLSQPFGVWDKSIDDMQQYYDVPQENGNRCEVQWCSVSGASASSADGKSVAATVPTLRASYLPVKSPASKSSLATTADRVGMQFATQIYDPAAIDDAKHPCDLPSQRRGGALWRIDSDVAGVGTGACGPGTEEKDQVACREREWTFLIEVLKAAE